MEMSIDQLFEMLLLIDDWSIERIKNESDEKIEKSIEDNLDNLKEMYKKNNIDKLEKAQELTMLSELNNLIKEKRRRKFAKTDS